MDASFLDYSSEDHDLLDIDALSRQARLSRAFIRLCIDCGCPLDNGRISHAQLLDWLAAHYPEVRAVAGLAALAPTDGVRTRTRRQLLLANTMLTLLEYAATRASDTAQKAQLWRM